jgi:transposase
MGLRQKFRNFHVVLSRPPFLAAIRKATLCGVRPVSAMVPAEAELESQSRGLEKLRISMDGAYLRFCSAPQKRKGIDSLARLCQDKLAEDPFSGCVFVFRSRSGTAIRLLSYDGQGYWLAQKRLSKGRFVWWPEGTEATKPLEAYEAQLLMAAGDLSRVRAAPMWRRVNTPK